MKARKLSRFAVMGIVGVALMFGIATLIDTDVAQAGKPGGGGGGGTKCPRTGIACPDIYAPVICSNGVVYSNSCYAYVYCATGCVPYGDPVIVE
jgi:hypothetical protein